MTPNAKILKGRYLTLGGAEVVVHHIPGVRDCWSWTWQCQGCPDDGNSNTAYFVQEQANKHASQCRAMPPEEPADETLSEIVTAITELGENAERIAVAVEDLVVTVEAAAAETAAKNAADLADRARYRPRRFWWGGRR